METIVIRHGTPPQWSLGSRPTSSLDKKLWLSIEDDGVVTLWTDSRPPISPAIELTREEALKVAAAIYERFPLDALGGIE